MRTAFVLTTIVLALTLGIIAGISGSDRLARVLVIGFTPAIWAASYLVERLMGRDMWHFTAPYPYRWMDENGNAGSTPSSALVTPDENTLEADDRSTPLMAA